MRRRAMTLVETLIALALLSAMSAACVSWTIAANRALTQGGGQIAWRAGAERTLDTLQQAMLIEDIALEAGARDARRVLLDRDAVDIRTRIVHRVKNQPRLCQWLRLHREEDLLVLEYISIDGDVVAERPLLADVASLETRVEELEHGALIHVRIRHESGTSIERTWRLTSEVPQ